MIPGSADRPTAATLCRVEEFRVSLFAQTLGTSLTVSAKRLEKQWTKVGQGGRESFSASETGAGALSQE
jgi:hypothetical protein